MTGCDSGCDSGGLEVTHFRLDVTITSITSITSGFCTDVTLDVHFQGAALRTGMGSYNPIDTPRESSDGMVTDRSCMHRAVQRLDATLDSDIVPDSQ